MSFSRILQKVGPQNIFFHYSSSGVEIRLWGCRDHECGEDTRKEISGVTYSLILRQWWLLITPQKMWLWTPFLFVGLKILLSKIYFLDFILFTKKKQQIFSEISFPDLTVIYVFWFVLPHHKESLDSKCKFHFQVCKTAAKSFGAKSGGGQFCVRLFFFAKKNNIKNEYLGRPLNKIKQDNYWLTWKK